MRLHKSKAGQAPFIPLFMKELRDLFAGRAFWALILFMSPLVGYSFIQAVSLFSAASRSALQFPALAAGLSPFDGIVVPTFGALYLAATLLFPFIAIRVIGAEKQNGGLKLLLQTPYKIPAIIGAKLLTLITAWLFALIPCLSSLIIWVGLGGHLGTGETLNLLLGYLLYILVISGISLFAAAITESSATAAIAALAFTIGFWVLDFAANQGGIIQSIAALSLTAVLHSFEQGIFSLSITLGALAAAAGLLAISGVWILYGMPAVRKFIISVVITAVTVIVMLGVSRIHMYGDMTEDRRNSFSAADSAVLSKIKQKLTITVDLLPDDPRYMDFNRSILGKLVRIMPDVKVENVSDKSTLFGTVDENYGLATYTYLGREATSRSTSEEEVLPIIYSLAGVSPPSSDNVKYPGYPLVADASQAGAWFYLGFPLLILAVWAFNSDLPQRLGKFMKSK